MPKKPVWLPFPNSFPWGYQQYIEESDEDGMWHELNNPKLSPEGKRKKLKNKEIVKQETRFTIRSDIPGRYRRKQKINKTLDFRTMEFRK